VPSGGFRKKGEGSLENKKSKKGSPLTLNGGPEPLRNSKRPNLRGGGDIQRNPRVCGEID